MSVTIEVAVNRFPALVGNLDATLESALDAGVTVAMATAFQRARVDTGRMRADVTVERSAGTRTITWNAAYSAYNEFGTVHMGAQPFAAPGAAAAAPVIAAHLGRFGT